MLLIPTGTDAPIYHWPRVTVAMMVINIVLFFVVPPKESIFNLDDNDEVTSVEVSNFDRYSLTLGNGLHPVQWLTHNFLHTGVMHLAGNMLFLWSFGIVVEGKLGPFKYLATYLALGTLHGALTQLVMLRADVETHAAGASAVIFGLLAMCMIWAPRNELSCTFILWVGFRILVYHWEFYYTTVALLYFGEQLLGLAFGGLTGRTVISELGHLSGGLWGTVLATVLLKAGWVDCEDWDVFSLWAKRKILTRAWKERGDALDRSQKSLKQRVKATHKTDRDRDAEEDPAERAAAALARVHKLIDKGDTAGAASHYDRSRRTLAAWPSQSDLYALIKAMHARHAEADSIRLMRDHCERFPAESSRMRLKLAHVLLRDRQRPTAALRVLTEIPAGSLPAGLETTRRKLAEQAARLQADGVLELEGDD